MLVGKYEQNIDAKGRVSIPAKFRAALGENFVVTAGEEKCALLYPVEEWNKFMERIASDFEPQVRDMFRETRLNVRLTLKAGWLFRPRSESMRLCQKRLLLSANKQRLRFGVPIIGTNTRTITLMRQRLKSCLCR